MAKNVFAGVGISRNDDPFKAGKESVEMAMEKMKKQGGKEPKFGLVFCSGGKYGKNDESVQKLVDGAHSVFGSTPWIGCTTAGEISSYGYSQSSCVAMAVGSGYIRVGVGAAEIKEKNSEKAGEVAISQAMKELKMDKQIDSYISYLAMKKREVKDLIKLKPFYVLMFSQGPLAKPEHNREDEILKGILSVTGRYVPVTGGSAGDDLKFGQTYVFRNGKAYKNSVVVMFLGSDVHIGVSLEHGYVPTDKTFMVTKADGHLIYELNKKPALQEYCKAINAPVDTFKKEPLLYCNKYVIGVPDGTGNYWSVVPGRVVGNALNLGAVVSQNTMICILEANEKMVLEAAKDATLNAIKDAGSNDISMALLFDCCIRWMSLKEKVAKEIKITQDAIGKDTPLIGFYTYGEYGARHLGAFCGHFNASTSSMVITNKLFAEK